MDMILFAALFTTMPISGLFWLGMRNEREALARERKKLQTLALWTKGSRRRRLLQ